MDTPILNNPPDGHHQYLGQRGLTRPDWLDKHEHGSKARNLLPYILEPHKNSDRILRDSTDSVLIKDKFPKAKIHLLILPKWLPHRDLHPHDAFEDPDFLAMVRREAVEGLKIAIPLLRQEMRRSLKKSGVDSCRSQSLLDTRDFSKDFQVGIHAHPSQHELHVHIISRDMVSWHEYDAGHYRAFNTPFLVPLASYPLSPNSQIREVEFQNNNLRKGGGRCWRCGQDFARNDYDLLRAHLVEEWHSWIREGLEDIIPNGVDDISRELQGVEISGTESRQS